jgi:hypothetical protein
MALTNHMNELDALFQSMMEEMWPSKVQLTGFELAVSGSHGRFVTRSEQKSRNARGTINRICRCSSETSKMKRLMTRMKMKTKTMSR